MPCESSSLFFLSRACRSKLSSWGGVFLFTDDTGMRPFWDQGFLHDKYVFFMLNSETQLISFIKIRLSWQLS